MTVKRKLLILTFLRVAIDLLEVAENLFSVDTGRDSWISVNHLKMNLLQIYVLEVSMYLDNTKLSPKS